MLLFCQNHHRYSELFKLEAIESYHKVIESEDFMEQLAPTHWPPGQRIAMCWQQASSKDKSCRMKEGQSTKEIQNKQTSHQSLRRIHLPPPPLKHEFPRPDLCLLGLDAGRDRGLPLHPDSGSAEMIKFTTHESAKEVNTRMTLFAGL